MHPNTKFAIPTLNIRIYAQDTIILELKPEVKVTVTPIVVHDTSQSQGAATYRI